MPFLLARAVLFTGRLWLAYVRVFVLFVLPYCTMVWGWWQPLPWYLHLPLLALWGYGLVWAYKNSGDLPRWPSEFEARRAIEQQRHLLHRPMTLQVDHPLHGLSHPQQALWQRAMAWAGKFQPRLLRPETGRVNDDPFGLRFVALLALVMTLAGVGQASVLHTLVPLHKLPFMGALQPQVEVRVTPPVYAEQPAFSWPQNKSKVFAVPGSTLAVRLPAAEKAWLVPNLKMAGQVIPLAWKNGVYEGQLPITGSTRVAVRLGWWPVFYGRVSALDDRPPVAGFTPPIKVSPLGVMNLSYSASDDYGLQAVFIRVYDLSTPGEHLDMPLHLPRVGDRQTTASDTLDLTLNPLAGQQVDIAVVARDLAGQESKPERFPLVLPERPFYHPVAQELVKARHKLRDGATAGSVLGDIAPLLAAPQAFGEDVRAFLSMAMARATLDEEAAGYRKRSMGFLWDAAVRVEDGPVKTIVQNVLRAQEALSKALAEGASGAALQPLFQNLQQNMFELLSRVQFGNEALPDALNNNDLAALMREIEDLLAAGATSRAQERLQQLKQLLANLQMGGDTAALRALMQSVQDMQHLAERQQKLNLQTFQHQEMTGIIRAQLQLAKDTDALRRTLAAQGLKTDRLAQAAEMMRAARAAFLAKDGGLGQAFQAKAYKALQEAQKALGEGLRQKLGYGNTPQIQRDPSGRPYGLEEEGVDVESKNPATLSRRIRDQLFNKAGDQTRPEAEKSYFRRLLEF